MDTDQFWTLVESARAQVDDPADPYAVAAQAADALAAYPRAEIVATQQTLWDLLAGSYRAPLWAAAHLINGGCSDDGFDYFRGWLLAQGREVFTQVVADPQALADLPAVRTALADGDELECEEVLGIVWNAHLAATGEQLPSGTFTIRYPALDPDWDFDFEDQTEIARRLPRLAELRPS